MKPRIRLQSKEILGRQSELRQPIDNLHSAVKFVFHYLRILLKILQFPIIPNEFCTPKKSIYYENGGTITEDKLN